MKNIELVKMKKREMLKAWRYQRKGFQDTLDKYRDYDTSPATEKLKKFCRRFLNPIVDSYWVLCGGKIAGAIDVGNREDHKLLNRFYILPEYRNRGIGQQALRIAEGKYPDAAEWRLDTILEEKNNIHLYEKLGYTEYGERKIINERMTIINYKKEVKPMKRQKEIELLNEYYNRHDEDSRLAPRANSVEFITTMKYIKKYLEKGMKILEIGAGTGRYSLSLADKGYCVDAVELIPHNIDVFNSKMKPNQTVTITQGDACDLNFIEDNKYDITLLLGPMYHLFKEEDRLSALSEAIRVTKAGGIVFCAYIGLNMNIYQQFNGGTLNEIREKGLIDSEFNAQPVATGLFMPLRKEDIDKMMAGFDVTRLHYVGTDMIHRYMMNAINAMDDETFADYMNYHYKTCERADCVGLSNHILDVFRKEG